MIVVLVGLAYLLGSIPVAWIIAKVVTGKDLRQMGSGNVGVMNVMISVSRWAGLMLFLAEAGKGVLSILMADAFGGSEIAVSVSLLAVVVGTRWPVWLRFHGGRGNTAGLAALLVLSWPTLVIGLGIWGLIRLLVRSSFWATRLSFAIGPIIFGVITQSLVFGLTAAVLSLIYLSSQEKATDDHLIIKQHWPSLWAFLTGPPRRQGDS